MLKLHDFETVLTFGKYKDKTIKELMDIDPFYIVWCVENIDGFCITKPVKEAIGECDGVDEEDWESWRFCDPYDEGGW